MVHNYSRKAITIIALVMLLLATAPVIVAGDEGQEIEVTIGTSYHDYLSPAKVEGSGPFSRLGQRLTIPNRLITEIGYRVWKVGNPTGDVIFSIREIGTDKAIISVVWGDASELPNPEAGGIRKVRLDEPIRVNGEVIICVEYYGGNMTDYCPAGYRAGNYRDGETYVNYYHTGGWHDIGEAEEGGYFYAYVDEGVVDLPPNGTDNGDTGGDDGGNTDWIIAGSVIGASIIGGGFVVYRDRVKRKKTPE